MDRRNVIWIVLLSVIPAGRPAAGQPGGICASCHANATCSSLPDGSGQTCICMYGFIGNGRTFCQDKDECQIGARKICGPRAACHNTVGSYACTCLGGFSPSNHRTSFTPNDGTYCQDVDECRRLPAVCGEGARCVNLEGDFECHCLLGYRAHNASEPFQPLRDKGSCKVVDCGPPPAGEVVQVLSTTGTTYGSVVLMGCQDGFLWRRGDNSSTCGPDGTWSRPAPLCEEVDCGSPRTPPHAHILRWDQTSRLGSQALYRCDPGHQNVGGEPVSVCSPSRHWEGTMLCKELSCGAPLTLPGTNRIWDGHSSAGSKVHYNCTASYYQEGGQNSAVSTCSETGEWGHVPLTCRARCGPAPLLAHAEVVWYNSSVTVHRCVDGYRSSRGGSVSVCDSAGQWQKATLKCIEVSCGKPPVLPHTGQLWNGNSSPGTVVFYTCKMGFHEDKIDFMNNHDAANMSVCNIHGNWTGPNILCKAVDCGVPPNLPHATALWPNGSTLGSSVLYQCDPGYRNTRGGNVSVCSASGEWSLALFLCQEIQCGEPLSKPHARMLWDNSTRVGSVLHYQCEEGYRPSPSTNHSICGEDGQWEESDLRCEELSCGAPLTLPGTNRIWDGRSSVGSKVHYNCAASYYQEGGQNNTVSTCSETGEWGHVPLNCRARCGPTPSLAHAEVVWYNSSMTVHRCMDGYRRRTGGSVSVCGSAGQWQKATLKCIEVKPAVSDLRVLNEKCLQWRAEKDDVDKEIYKVVFRGTREYQGAFRHERRQLLHSGDEWVEVCLSLLPATNYTISVIALSTRFTANITTNTSLQVPQAPLILYRELDAPPTTLRLQRSAHTLDAISVYQVVVVPLDGTVVFDCRSRGSLGSSQGDPPSGQYVTGQFPLSQMNETELIFTVGDGRFHGGFFNAPLKRGTNYYVILRVVSHWKEAFKSSCVLWAKVTGTSYVMRVSSLWAAGSVGVLLLLVLLGYGFSRGRDSPLNSQ